MKSLILIYDHVLSDIDVQTANDLLGITSFAKLDNEMFDAFSYLVRTSFSELSNCEVSFCIMKDCVNRPALLMSKLRPWRTLSLNHVQRQKIGKLCDCVQVGNIVFEMSSKMTMASQIFNRKFKKLIGHDSLVIENSEGPKAWAAIEQDIIRVKALTCEIVDSATY